MQLIRTLSDDTAHTYNLAMAFVSVDVARRDDDALSQSTEVVPWFTMSKNAISIYACSIMLASGISCDMWECSGLLQDVVSAERRSVQSPQHTLHGFKTIKGLQPHQMYKASRDFHTPSAPIIYRLNNSPRTTGIHNGEL